MIVFFHFSALSIYRRCSEKYYSQPLHLTPGALQVELDPFAHILMNFPLTDDDASRICASCECDRERRRPRLRPRQRARPFCHRSIRRLRRQWPRQCRCVWPLFSSPLRDCVYVARSHPDPSQGLIRTSKQRETLISVSTISFYAYAFTPSSKITGSGILPFGGGHWTAFQIRPPPAARIMCLTGPTRRDLPAPFSPKPCDHRYRQADLSISLNICLESECGANL